MFRYNNAPLTSQQKALLIVVLIAALLGRAIGLGTHPPPFSTSDEFHFLWTGLSLLHGERPMTWSNMPVYPARGDVEGEGEFRGHRFTTVRPGLDHPPLFSLVAAAYAEMVGAVRGRIALTDATKPGMVWDVDLTRARTLTLFLSLATFLLLFEIARREFDYWVALFAVAIHGLLAFSVLQGRLLVTENLTTPFLLANVLLVQRLVAGQTQSRRFGWLTGTLVAASTFCKLVAVCQAGVIILLLLVAKRPWRELMYPLLGAALGIALYIGYGALEGWETLVAVLREHGTRFDILNPWQLILGYPQLIHTGVFTLLIQLGWVFILVNQLGGRPSAVLSAPIAFLLGHIFFAAVDQIYGWHMLPYLPFVGIALAWGILEVSRSCRPMPAFALAAILLPGAGQFLLETYPEYRGQIRWLYGIALAAGVMLCAGSATRRQRIVRYGVLAAFLLLAAREVRLAVTYQPG